MRLHNSSSKHILKNGLDDAAKQASDDITTASNITVTFGSSVGAAFPSAASEAATIVEAITADGDTVNWTVGSVNCDGIVLSDAVTGTALSLAALVTSAGTYSETRSYTGPETPTGCGSDAKYSDTWTLLLER